MGSLRYGKKKQYTSARDVRQKPMTIFFFVSQLAARKRARACYIYSVTGCSREAGGRPAASIVHPHSPTPTNSSNNF